MTGGSASGGDPAPPEDVASDDARAASPTASLAPSDAFQALAGEPRTAVLRALAADAPRSFSELHAATDVDASAGFAYHLRQLDGHFVRQRDDGPYELTAAGREAARTVRTGAVTHSVDRDRIPLDDACPFCDDDALAARVADNRTRVACEACDAPILELPFPPSGYVARDADAVPSAVDAYHRSRIETFAAGVCADCGAPVSTTIEPADDAAESAVDAAEPALDASEPTAGPSEPAGDVADTEVDELRVRAAFACSTCGTGLRCPVALTVLDHPAVVAFFHGHDRDVRERPIWNVGPEWSERVLSRDPWCVVVRVALDGDLLELYVAGDGRVVDHRRWNDFDDEVATDGTDRSTAADSTAGDRSVPETSGSTAAEDASDGATA